MDIQLINSISDHAANNFGDILLGKAGRFIQNPLSLIFDPINETSRQVVDNISGNIGIISGSEDKRGLAALNQTFGGFIDNTFNNVSPGVLLIGGLGLATVLVIALKL